MARLAGLGSFVGISAGVLLGLRLLHVGIPVVFPETRPGPFFPDDLDEAARLAGFAPLVPAYRPAVLGEAPSELRVTRAPRPTIRIEWRAERFLVIDERKGGGTSELPAAASPLGDRPDAAWWESGSVRHLVLRRGDVWIRAETDLPVRDLERIADTLGPW